MNTAHLPVILIELVLVVGGLLLFGWWQLRSVRRDRDKAAAERAAKTAMNQVNLVNQVSPVSETRQKDPAGKASEAGPPG